MPKNTILFFFIILTICSCRQTNNTNVSLRDSALKSYISSIDTFIKNETRFYDLDSNEYSFKMLKAYYLNDTSYLRKIVTKNEIDDGEFTKFWMNNVSILKRLQIEEGYQFQYSETFCRNYYVITITKSNSTVKLNKIIFRPTRIENDKLFDFKILETSNKILTLENWDKLLETLRFADYWNLKANSNNFAIDPSFLTVLGIEKDASNSYAIKKTHSVERTIFRSTAIYQSFLLALKFADIDKLCEN